MKIYSFLVAGINGFLYYYLLKILLNDKNYISIIGSIYVAYLTYQKQTTYRRIF